MNSRRKYTKEIIFSVFFSSITFFMFAQAVPDKEIKRNVTEISTPLQKLIQLEPIVFEYNTEKYKHLKLKSGLQFGFMSDNMHQVFPELVTAKYISYMFGKNLYRGATIKTIDETSLIPVLVAAIKEQQVEIEKLKKDIAEMKAAKITIAD